MESRYAILVLLLALVLIIVYVLMGYNPLDINFLQEDNPVLKIRQDFISELERITGLEVEIEEMSFWPLNRIILKNVRLNREHELFFTAAEIKIYYNLSEMIKYPENWLSALTYIKMDRPQLIVSQELNQLQNFSDAAGNYAPEAEVDKFAQLYGIDIYFEDGLISITENERQLRLAPLTGLVSYENNNQFNLEVKTGLAAKGLQLNKYLQHYDIDFNEDELFLEKITLTLNYSKNNWQASINTQDITPQLISRTSLLTDINSYSQLQVEDIKGRGETSLTLSGTGMELASYQVQYKFTAGEALVNYGDNIISEKLDRLNGNILIDSGTEMIAFKDFNFNFSDNPYNFQGKFYYADREKPRVEGVLASPGIQLSDMGFRFEQLAALDLSGSAQFKIKMQGDFFEPDFDLDFYVDEGRLGRETINYLKTDIRYREGLVFVDFFDLNINNDTQISLAGLMDSHSKNYSFDLQAGAVNTDIINNYLGRISAFEFQLPDKINGDLNLDFFLTGSGFAFDDLNLLGDFTLVSPAGGDNEINQIESRCWLAEEKLIFHKGSININNSQIDFSGEIDLADEELDIKVSGQEIDVAVIDNFLAEDFSYLAGSLDTDGNLSGTIDEPHLNLQIAMSEGKLMEYGFDDLKAVINYYKNNIEVTKITLRQNETVVNGSGLITLKPVVSRIDADLSLKNLKYSQLDRYLDFSIPAVGSLSAQLHIGGPLDKFVVEGQLNSTDTEAFFTDNNYLLDQLHLDFSWQQDSSLQVNQLQLVSDETTITASGELDEDSLDLRYHLHQLQLTKIPLAEISQLSGKIDSTGRISGEYADPELSGKLTASELVYEQRQLHRLTGEYKYYDGILEIDKGHWQFGSSNYEITGNIKDLPQEPQLEMRIETEDAKIVDLVEIMDVEMPVKLQGYLQGTAEINGPINNPEAVLDVSVYNRGAPASLMTVRGQFGKELDLKIEGNRVNVSRILQLQGRELALTGKTSFNGSISGEIDNFNLELQTLVSDGRVNNYNIDKVEGRVTVKTGNIINIEQKFTLDDNSDFEVKGDIILGEEDLLALTLNLNRVSLEFISRIMTSFSNIQGEVTGNFRIAGTIDNPDFGGRLSLRNGALNILTDLRVKDITGSLLFEEKQVRFEDFSGIYAREKVSASGEIRPFNSDNFWNLNISGNNLPFHYGSFNGLFDVDNVKITGALLTPLISGELLTHDFIVSMPFSWSRGEDEQSDNNEDTGENRSGFTTEYDLILYPGEDIYFESDDRINVLIEEGSLRLTYIDEEFNLEGELSSSRGSFDYYNNKFMLENGRVTFERYGGYIPGVYARAVTVIDGIKIIVTVDGQADNMMTTLTSQPSLSEEEILDLLASKGGLGQFVRGGELDLFQVISGEFIRFFREKLQLDLITNIEEKFKDIFELDRMEIDAYELGADRDINLYLGKRLSDKFYLEYTGRFTPVERKDEISFRYYLDDSLHLEGSWFGDDDYQFSIEKSIEF